MNKIQDISLFKNFKFFLTVYLPKIRSKSPNTIQAYKCTLNIFICFMKEVKGTPLYKLEATDFNRDNILDFFEWLQTDRKNSDATRNQRLMCIRVFCKYLAGEDILSYESYSRIQEIKGAPVVERYLDETLSIDEVKYLLELPNVSTRFGLRDRFYIALLYDTGCRNSEILGIKLGDIRLNKDCGSVKVMGKGMKPRIIPLSKEVVLMYKQYEDIFHPNKDCQMPLFFISRNSNITPMSPDNAARILVKYEMTARFCYPELPHLHPHLFRNHNFYEIQTF